jgi:hypothetical protein
MHNSKGAISLYAHIFTYSEPAFQALQFYISFIFMALFFSIFDFSKFTYNPTKVIIPLLHNSLNITVQISYFFPVKY